MKKKIFVIICLLVAFVGSLYGLNIEYNIEEENTTVETIVEDVVEETEDDNTITEVTDVIISEEAEEIVRDTIQATEERRRFKYIRRNRKYSRRGTDIRGRKPRTRCFSRTREYCL